MATPSPIQKVRDMPWLLGLEMRRLLLYPVARTQFAWHGIAWKSGWRIFGRPIIQKHRSSQIEAGPNLVLRSWTRSNPLAPTHPVVLSTRNADAELRIGTDCGFTGAVVVAGEHVSIGDRVQVGGNAQIVDTDFHPLTPEGRAANFNAGATRPIVIEDDVFIGMNALVLKGVTLGAGCVVGAGSVVSRDVPPRTIVAGNPARVVRELREGE